MSKTNTKTKKKVSIADLQSKPKRLTLVHPDETLDVGDAWVELVSSHSSLEYMLIVMKLSKMDLATLEPIQELELQADLVVSVMRDWDEESFGVAFSKEAAKHFLMQPDNLWIRQQIEGAVKEDSGFFTKA